MGPANIEIQNVKLGTDVRNDKGMVIGKLLRYFPESGRLDLEVDSTYRGPEPDITQIISSHGL